MSEGKTLLDKMVVDEMSVDEMSVDETSVDEMSVDKTSVDKTSVDKTSVDKTSVDKIAGSHSQNSFNQGQSFVKSQCDQKNGPSNPPTNFIQLKFCPNNCAIFSLNKNCPMLKIFAQSAKFFPIWSH
jgi:hypothetical protein